MNGRISQGQLPGLPVCSRMVLQRNAYLSCGLPGPIAMEAPGATFGLQVSTNSMIASITCRGL